jgi:hypothetical protein
MRWNIDRDAPARKVKRSKLDPGWLLRWQRLAMHLMRAAAAEGYRARRLAKAVCSYAYGS